MRRDGACGERGASAVEAALVAPVVFLLLFGIIEMGMLFKDYQSVGGLHDPDGRAHRGGRCRGTVDTSRPL